jgi:hypothetical protein
MVAAKLLTMGVAVAFLGGVISAQGKMISVPVQRRQVVSASAEGGSQVPSATGGLDKASSLSFLASKSQIITNEA